MYNIKLDENNYYTGSYATVGKVEGGIEIPTLPPTADLEKALFYKYDYHNITVIEQQPSDELDEYGNQVYEDVEVVKSVLDWIFDETKYNEYLVQKSKETLELTTDEKIIVLQEENELLKGCIMELASIIFE